MNASQILQEVKRAVHKTDPTAILILYGSYARGEQREGSDIDILVLLDKDKVTVSDIARIGKPIFHIELGTGAIISPFVCSKKQWETKHVITPFYKNIMREGRQI